MRAELNVLVYQCNLKFKKYVNHVFKNAIYRTMIGQYMCLHFKSRINYSLLTLYIDDKNLQHETIY